jgi:hypothetical protein
MRWALIGAALLALLACLLPWLDCPHCEASQVPLAEREKVAVEGWSCPACFDRERVSVFGRLRPRRLAPALLALASRPRLLGPERHALLAANGLDPAAEYRPRGSGFPWINGEFFDTDAGWRYLLEYSGSRGMFGPRHPLAFPVRFYLFDEEGRLLDRWEIAPAGPKLCGVAACGTSRGEVVAEIVPYLGDPLPEDAAFDFIRDGTSERRKGTSMRLTLRSGRLAELP